MNPDPQEFNPDTILRGLEELLDSRWTELANMANMASYLFHSLHDLNWLGFYLLTDGKLSLGPFQGKPACIEIEIGKGVCGTAFAQKQTVVVQDVEDFPGHIACDPASRSEIVVPVYRNGAPIGVLDVDSPSIGRFSAREQDFFERAVKIFENAISGT